MSGSRFLFLLLALSFIALAQCASADLTMVPTEPGNRWEFEVVKLLRARITYEGKTVATLKDPASGSAVYEVVSADSKQTPPVYDYRESVDLMSTNGHNDTRTTRLNIVNEDGDVKILSTVRESSGEKNPDKQSYDPPLFYYSKGAANGQSWDVGEMRDGETRSATTARGAGRETVTVPAGTFKDCLKVIYTSDSAAGTIQMWDKTFTITSARSRGIYWIAEGVGVVKELEIATSVASADGPDSKPVIIEAASCTVSELKPGYVVKKQADGR